MFERDEAIYIYIYTRGRQQQVVQTFSIQ